MSQARSRIRFSLRGLLVFMTALALLTGFFAWWFREPPIRWRTLDEILAAYNIETDLVVGTLPDRKVQYRTGWPAQLVPAGSSYKQPRNPIQYPNLPLGRIHVPPEYELRVLPLETPDNQSVGLAWFQKRPSHNESENSVRSDGTGDQ